MRSPDNSPSQPHLKNDLDRNLRSTSPAIKRPASDMGAQDREDHEDVRMQANSSGSSHQHSHLPSNSSDLKAKQQYTDEHHNNPDKMKDVSEASHPPTISQIAAPSDSTGTSISDSLLPTPSIRSTAATSVAMDVAPTATEPPSIDQQIAKVMALKKDPAENQKGYAISNKWLIRVFARSTEPPSGYDTAAAEGEIGPVDNSDLVLITDDSGRLLDQVGDMFVQFRPGLQMGQDYEIVPEEAWQLILSWYGLAKGSPVITRYAYDVSPPNTTLEIADIKYETDPPIFSFLKVAAEPSVRTQREADLPPVRIVASKYMQTMQWLKQAKQGTHIDINTKVRVWRILSGLKNTHTGIATPAASRSASPAPGAEITVNAGDRMLLDVNTFAALSLGDQREKMELDDQTNNQNYNGKSTLALIGLGRSDVVVLEEQKGGPAGGEWPSEHTRLGLPKTQKDKLKSLTPSGRTSPAPGSGPTTRGRSMREGRTPGLTGLSNLGNTCYMNSALQSLRSVKELTDYFLHGEYKRELNKDNPLGHDGHVATAYGQLIHQIYNEGSNSCSPSKFKQVIGKYGPSFSGYQQQDSQEFLLFLLDGLGEDLNRIVKKPYIEKPDSTDDMVQDHQALQKFADQNWADYKARNDSVVTDLFAGMYKSTLTCPECHKVSIIFDPFTNLTLQLPIENNWAKDVAFVPLYGRPIRIDVEIDKNSSIRALKEFVAKRTNTNPDFLVVAEDYKNRFYKIFDNNVTMSESSIQTNDVICVYELEDKPTNYNPDKIKKQTFYSGVSNDDEIPDPSDSAADKMLVPVFNRNVKTPGSRLASRPFFGLPTFIVISREENKSYDNILKKLLAKVQTLTTKSLFEEAHDADEQEDSDTVIMNDDGSGSGPTTSSEQNSDGYVDVDMRDSSVAPVASVAPAGAKADGLETDAPKIKPFLSSKAPVSDQLRSLFTPCMHKTGEGIPTGWNHFNENSEYTTLLSRLPKQVPHRPAKKRSSDDDSDGDAGSESSNDDLPDIMHDEEVPSSADSSEESTASAQPPSMTDSEDPGTEFQNMAKSRGQNRHGRNKTYKRKGKIIQGARVQQRKPAPQSNRTFQPAPTRVPVSETGLLLPGEALILDWNNEAYEALFGGSADDESDFRGAPLWKNVPALPDPELAAKRQLRASRRKNGVTLEDCLEESRKPEILSEQNAWYCPRCKTHRRAEKKFELWKCPDILVMHLKRFSSNRNFRDKLDVKVEYPIDGLDMSTMIQDVEEGKSMVYDLIAVDNHYGGLGGGHYTAYAKHPVNNQWYEYNDASVSQRTPAAVVTAAAYLLFYRRRGDYPLGGPQIQKLLSEAESEPAAQQSRETSPAGEGRRLGGSSHNGSSSAYPAGPAHLVGDGGAGKARSRASRGLTPEEDHSSHHKSIEMDADGLGNELPDYHSATMEHGQPSPPEDEGLGGMDYEQGPIGPLYGPASYEPGWSFTNLRQHNNSDEDMFGGSNGSNESTRVAGSRGSSVGGLLDDVNDTAQFSDMNQDDLASRSMRESAPPPIDDFQPIPVASMEDDDDELPVAELHADGAGDFEVKQVPK